jgi:Helix-turn-helix domain
VAKTRKSKLRSRQAEPEVMPEKAAELITSGLQNPDDLLTTEQAAKVLGTTPGTLNTWRCVKRYPLAYIKIGRSVKYRRSDLVEFCNARRVVA